MNGDNFSTGFKTKRLILGAMSELLKTEPYEKLGVLDICKEAGIARSTFYHHFCSKDAVLEWHTNMFYSIGLDRIGRDLDCYTGHLITTRELYPYRHLYTGSSASLENLAGPRSAFIRHRYETLCQTVTKYHHLELTPQLKFQIDALSVAEAHVSKNWLQGISPIGSDMEEYCKAIVTIIPQELRMILDKPVQEKSTEFMFLGLN